MSKREVDDRCEWVRIASVLTANSECRHKDRRIRHLPREECSSLELSMSTKKIA